MAVAAPRSARVLLTLAAVAIAFAAADTYVVVLALPDMMTAVDLPVSELQRAAPIISGFLLGYVAVLPVIGRVSDLRGRVPVLVGSLVVFLVGSLVTAAAYDLPSMVVGRLLQGVGGGGLIPPTLALVAAAWPPQRRGVPLGAVGAVQELGSVLGPLYGAVVLAVGSWRDIFWVNAAVALVLAAALRTVRDSEANDSNHSTRRLPDLVGVVLLVLALVALTLTMLQPESLTSGVMSGLAFLPVVGSSRWLAPVGLATLALTVGLVVRTATARRPLVQWRSWRSTAAEIDLVGALALTVALSAVIVTFASADPERAALSADAWWLLPLAVLALVVVVVRQRRATHPLVPRGALVQRPAWGAVVVSFVIGASLIAALVDIPFFARITTERESQLGAALVLVRFLVALPIGALLGGWLSRRIDAGLLTAIGMVVSALSFWHMSTWGPTSLDSPWETLSLVAAGLGFGLAIAPVNAALLDHTADEVHGVGSSLLVVGRMVGMLVGISVLSAVGLQAFRGAVADIPADICGSASVCDAYQDAVRDAGITQLHTVFLGAALLAALAAVLAVTLLSTRRHARRPTRLAA